MAGANRYYGPRKGSLQIWPRVRAKRMYSRIRNWSINGIKDTKLLGFLGYKAGMTHIIVKDNTPNSLNKGKNLSVAATIIECPPLKPLSIRFYKKAHDGLQIISEIPTTKVDKELKRKLAGVSKKQNSVPESYDDVRLMVYSQPRLTGVQKKPQIIEVGFSGTKEQKLELAKQLLEKEIKVTDIFKEGSYLDVHGISKGKGFQGTVKRYGVKIRQHKSEKVKRGIGSLGSWHPNRVLYTVAQAGRMGMHQRTDYNRFLIKIEKDVAKVNPKGGFMHYGLVKNDYLIIKGSIPGTANRPIILTDPVRPNKKILSYEILEINKDSKQ